MTEHEWLRYYVTKDHTQLTTWDSVEALNHKRAAEQYIEDVCRSGDPPPQYDNKVYVRRWKETEVRAFDVIWEAEPVAAAEEIIEVIEKS